jgi:hypothetical protein
VKEEGLLAVLDMDMGMSKQAPLTNSDSKMKSIPMLYPFIEILNDANDPSKARREIAGTWSPFGFV